MKKGKLFTVLFLSISISAGVYLLIKTHLYQPPQTEGELVLSKEEFALLQKIDGEWYCSEDDQLYTIVVKDEKNITVKKRETSKYKVSSISSDKQFLSLVNKQELDGQVSTCRIDFSDEDTITIQFGVGGNDPDDRPEDMPYGSGKPLNCQRN